MPAAALGNSDCPRAFCERCKGTSGLSYSHVPYPSPRGNRDYWRDMPGLVEDFVLPFFGDQLLEMVHNLVAARHDRLNFRLGEKSFRSCC